jgi:uncharacterized membrane protein YgdD (TMEM256/DUF423 family)
MDALARGSESKQARPMSIERTALLLACVAGFSGVALGAFGAHGLKGRLAGAADAEQRTTWWLTGAQYHLVHALAIGLAAIRPSPAQGGSALAPWLFLAGIALFSGSLYTMALTGIRKLGAITPLGGLSFLAGWTALAYHALKIVD